MTKIFETSLFGYSKQGVLDYNGRMNEEFSQKLLLRDQLEKDNIQKLEEEVAHLRRENEQLRQENGQLRSVQLDVASALIEAKTHANGLIRQAEKDDQVMRAANRARRTEQLQRIQTLVGDVNSLQADFCKILHTMEKELENYRLQGEALERKALQEMEAEPEDNPLQDESSKGNPEPDPAVSFESQEDKAVNV